MGRKKIKLDKAVDASEDTSQQQKKHQERIATLLNDAASLLDKLEGNEGDDIALNIRSACAIIENMPLNNFDILSDREERDIDKHLDYDEKNHDDMLNTAIGILNDVEELVSRLDSNIFKSFSTRVDVAEDALEKLLSTCSCHEDKTALGDEADDEADDEEMAVIESSVMTTSAKTKTEHVYQMGEIKYAPVMPVKQGNYVLNVGSVGYSDVRGVNINQCVNMGNAIKKAYAELSDGRINILVRAKKFDTGMVRSKSAGSYGTSKVKDMFPAPPAGYHEMFATIKNGSEKFNHAGGNTASLTSALITTGKHEIGHVLKGKGIPNLQHANRWAEVIQGSGKKKKKVWEFQSSRDGSSFMSIYSASLVTALQKYSQGWYYERQVAMYEIGDPTMTYKIQLVDASQKDNRVNGILIPQGKGKAPLFLSLYQIQLPGAKNKGKKETLMALHTGEKGSSTRLSVFANSFEPSKAEPTKNIEFAVDVVDKVDDHWTIKIRPTV